MKVDKKGFWQGFEIGYNQGLSLLAKLVKEDLVAIEEVLDKIADACKEWFIPRVNTIR